MTAPGPLDVFAPYKEHHAIVLRVPDADLLGSRAPARGDHDDLGVAVHDEHRMVGYCSLQPLPIEPNPFGLETELGGKRYEA